MFSLGLMLVVIAGAELFTGNNLITIAALNGLAFGGGLEITTLAAIPSGSGLGTSSIMGAVLISVIGRVIGRPLTERELFHAVLKSGEDILDRDLRCCHEQLRLAPAGPRRVGLRIGRRTGFRRLGLGGTPTAPVPVCRRGRSASRR